MFAKVSFERIEETLRTPPGWIELAIVVGCFSIAWLIDYEIRRRRGDEPSDVVSLQSGVVRFAMPLIALMLMVIARAVWRRYLPSLFLDAGIVLALALAAIRVVVYMLRRLVPNAAWLRTSERTVGFAVWTLVALHVLGVTPEIAQELDALRIPIGKNVISVLTLLKGAAAVIVTLSLTLWISGLIEQRLAKTHLDQSQRALASKFIRAILIVLGVLIAFQAIGFDLTLLTVFGGALGVGIGLGLQKLASNYIAGFVILMDRSVRLGDLVTIDNRYGEVTQVTSRYVVVRGLDQIEAIIPNETLVTSTVLNHSYTNREVRVGVTISVAYGTDLDRALDLLRDVAAAHPRVVSDPGKEPTAFVVRFAESGIELELGVWIRDPEAGQLGLKSDLNRTIWKAFVAAGIVVPFPQREVRVVAPPGTGAAAAGPSPERDHGPGPGQADPSGPAGPSAPPARA